MKKLILLLYAMSIHAHIMIDPGHGGRHRGAASPHNTHLEKDAALAVAKEIAKKLKAARYRVSLTRSQDTDFAPDKIEDLQKRIELIGRAKPDVVVSIHFNASENPSVRGLEVYVPMGTTHVMPSYGLAASIHHELVTHGEASWVGNLGNINALDRGIRASRLNVLEKSTCPAVLIEVDYISHPKIEESLSSPEYIERIARDIVSGIIKYMQSKKSWPKN